jgi:uncharacterized membrane protein YidH (DUF202 family)
MSQITRTLILLEAAVCFGNPCIVLFVGIVFAPGLLGAASVDAETLGMLLAVVGGCIGMYGIIKLVRRILNSDARAPRPWVIWVCLSVGICTSFLAARHMFDPDVQLFSFGLPFAATLHFIYLGRSYLLGGRAVDARKAAHLDSGGH